MAQPLDLHIGYVKWTFFVIALALACHAKPQLDPQTQARVDQLVNELLTTGTLRELPPDIVPQFMRALVENPNVPPNALKLKTINKQTGDYDYWTAKELLQHAYPDYYASMAEDGDMSEWLEENQGNGGQGNGGQGNGGNGGNGGNMDTMAIMQMLHQLMSSIGGGGSMGPAVGELDLFVKALSGMTLDELNNMARTNSTVLIEDDMQKVADLAKLTSITKELGMLSSKPVGKYCVCV